MNDQLLDSLSVPTGEAGWPQLGDWLFRSEEMRGVVNYIFMYDNETIFKIEVSGERVAYEKTHINMDQLKQDFPRHVPIMKLLEELVESRKYIEQVAPLLHIHGFEYKKDD